MGNKRSTNKYLEDGILLHQPKYINTITKKFGMNESKSTKTPSQPNSKLYKTNESDEIVDETNYRSIVGGLMYIANCTRPDISFSVNYAARFCTNPNKNHLAYVKHILRYLNTNSDLGIFYKKEQNSHLKFYSDSDYGSDTTDAKSTSGHIVCYNNSPISWRSLKQNVVALSTTEAEIISATSLIKTALHINEIHNFISNKMHERLPLLIYGDNNAANTILTNNILSNKTKHIRIRFGFIKDLVDNNIIKINRVDTNENFADLLTKSLPLVKLRVFINFLNMRNEDSTE